MSRTVQTLTIQPGEIGRVAIAGEGFAVTESTLAVFEVAIDGDSFAEFRQGWQYSPPGGFEVLVFQNPNLAALTIEVVIWAGEFADRRFSTTSPITSIPRTDLAALVEAPGYVTDESQSAVALEFARVQLFNPAASGVLLEVQQIIGSTSGTSWAVRRFDTQFGSAVNVEINPLDTRAPAAKAEVTRDTVVGGSLSGNILFGRSGLVANEVVVVDLPIPIKIAEGHGMFVNASFNNTDLDIVFFWTEIPL